jgi:hypothetical protein
MIHRFLASISSLVIVIALVSLAPERATGQDSAPANTTPAKATPAAKSWAVPRTADGQPDLQGIWANSTLTPLERPRELGDKQFFT